MEKVSAKLSSVLITGQGNLQGAVSHDVHQSSESTSQFRFDLLRL